MPSCISHAVVGACAGAAVSNGTAPRRLMLYSVIAAVLPDVDVVFFAFNLPRDSLFSHRGICHSILFAALAGLLLAWLFWRRERISSGAKWFFSGYFFVVVLLHGVLDACTNGGEGVAFFAPFFNQRMFFHFTPIEVSPVNPLVFLHGPGAEILANELVWVWMPAFGVAAANAVSGSSTAATQAKHVNFMSVGSLSASNELNSTESHPRAVKSARTSQAGEHGAGTRRAIEARPAGNVPRPPDWFIDPRPSR